MATERPTTALDEIMPRFDVRSRHRTVVAADAARVAQALETVRISEASVMTRTLFRVRGLKVPAGSLRDALTRGGFTLLAERPGEEIVFGVAGRFWSLRERDALMPLRDADHARAFCVPGAAVGAWSFTIGPAKGSSGGATLLQTETRVRCVDQEARRRFRLYWAIVGPFSGLTRRDLLRAVKDRAERS